MNVNLNVGGILGGLFGAVVGFILCFAGGSKPEFRPGMTQVIIIAVVVGALGGNFVWRLVFGKPATDQTKKVDKAKSDQPQAKPKAAPTEDPFKGWE